MSNACIVSKLPEPQKSKLKQLGFMFEEIIDCGINLYKVTLPDGWEIPSSKGCRSNIIDSQKRKRGEHFLYKEYSHGKLVCYTGHIDLNTRYAIEQNVDTSSGLSVLIIRIIDTLNGNIVFDSSKSCFGTNTTYSEAIQQSKKFLDENFPDWENPMAYWD